MIRQADRHDRKRSDVWIKSQQVLNRSFQMDFIVQSWAQHDLAMHLNAGPRETLDFGHEAVVFLDAQERPPQLGFLDIRQSQIIPEQKRQPIILILDVKRPPDFLWILMHETEHALVLAC